MPLGRLRELEVGVKPCNVGVRSTITAWHAVGTQRSNAGTLLSISSLCRSGLPPSLPRSPAHHKPVWTTAAVSCAKSCYVTAPGCNICYTMSKSLALLPPEKKHSRTDSEVRCVSCASCPHVTQGQDLYRIEHKLDVSMSRKNFNVFIYNL
jgi:hypothetical protein